MSIERIYPKPENVERYRPQLQRYDFAVEQMGEPKRVLDFMCGVGYGAAHMMKAGHDVVAFDKSIEAYTHAKEYFPEVNYICTTWQAIGHFVYGKFDYVVCFEAVEHIGMYMTGLFFATLKHFLKPEGTLIISTPCAKYDGQAPKNEHHKNTFSRERWAGTLHDNFNNVELYRQVNGKIVPTDKPWRAVCIGVCND